MIKQNGVYREVGEALQVQSGREIPFADNKTVDSFLLKKKNRKQKERMLKRKTK